MGAAVALSNTPLNRTKPRESGRNQEAQRGSGPGCMIKQQLRLCRLTANRSTDERGSMTDDLCDRIKAGQQTWASDRGLAFDSRGYCESCTANLFEPLTACSLRDIERGDGAELGIGNAKGKIQALHSSTALACNVFDYWRGRNLAVLRKGFGLSTRLCGLAFEQKFPTGAGGSANLDVVLYGCDGTIFAIESKFTEPFKRSKNKCFLKPKYFPPDRSLWKDTGLPGCQVVAENLRDGVLRFETLDAAQLLKHMLGLGRSRLSWNLMCIWYAPGGQLSNLHSEELATFSRALGVDSQRFRAMTYQDLFRNLELGPEDADYMAYLQTRYFAGALSNKALNATGAGAPAR